jgi:hypothetical protein
MQDYKEEMKLLKKISQKNCISDKFNELTSTCSDA